jgi:hypothetical protein
MNRGRAETHLRQLAETELRHATEPGALGRGPAGRLPLVAQALIAVGAVDVGTADQAGFLTSAGLLDILGHAGRPVKGPCHPASRKIRAMA